MGGDKVMMETLLYIAIVIMAFVFAVTINNTITKRGGDNRYVTRIRIYKRGTSGALRFTAGIGYADCGFGWESPGLYVF